MNTIIDWIKSQTESIRQSLSQFANRDFMEAVAAGCALTAAADGVVRPSEKEKLERFFEGSDILKDFDFFEMLAAFERYTERMEQDYLLGEAEALRAVGMVRPNPVNARHLVRVCSAICVSDGEFHDKEASMLRRICNELELDLETLIGSPEETMERAVQTVSVSGAVPPPIPAESRPPESAEPQAEKNFILAGTSDPKKHRIIDVRTGKLIYECTDVSVVADFSVMISGRNGENVFNINAGAEKDSASVYDNSNRLLASIRRTDRIYRHLGIDDADKNRLYDLAEASASGVKEWTVRQEETEIGGIRIIDAATAREFMGDALPEPDDISFRNAFLMSLGGPVEETDLFILLGTLYLLMAG